MHRAHAESSSSIVDLMHMYQQKLPAVKTPVHSLKSRLRIYVHNNNLCFAISYGGQATTHENVIRINELKYREIIYLMHLTAIGEYCHKFIL